jgi:hypothetical protein
MGEQNISCTLPLTLCIKRRAQIASELSCVVFVIKTNTVTSMLPVYTDTSAQFIALKLQLASE